MMRLLRETILIFVQIIGVMSACIIYYLCFVALGETTGVMWAANLAYMIVTIILISFFAAKDKIRHEDSTLQIYFLLRKVLALCPLDFLCMLALF